MNVKKFQHPTLKTVIETRDFLTARALKAAGWRELRTDAPVTVTAGEGKRS